MFGGRDQLKLSGKVSFDNDSQTLTEEVITHNIYPKRRATRTQGIGVSYLELNAKPVITIGDWTFEEVKA